MSTKSHDTQSNSITMRLSQASQIELRQLIRSINGSNASKRRAKEKIDALQAESNSDKLMQALHFHDAPPFSRNLGQQVARYQNAANTQAYLGLIRDLMDKPDVVNTVILALLTNRARDGWTLGDYIARYQDAASTQAYLGLIRELMDKPDVANTAVLALLTSQTRYGRTLGDIIAHHQDATSTQDYLGLIRELMDKPDVAITAVLALLTSQAEDGWTLGDYVAHYNNAASTQAYLDLITDLMDKPDVANNEVLALLTSQNISGWTMGNYIARHKDAASTQAYLGLIRDLMDKPDVANNEVLALLKSQTRRGRALGNCIASFQDAASTQAYLDFITDLMDKPDVANNEVLALFTSQDTNGWTIGHTIACFQDTASTKAYLGLITALMNDETIANRDVLALLTSQTTNGWTLGDRIARCQDAASFGAFAEVLGNLFINNNTSPNTRAEIRGASISLGFLTSTTLIGALVRYDKVEILYQILINNLADAVDIKIIAKGQKQALLDYIIELPNEERARALRQIHERDEASQLSAVFETTRGFRAVSIHRGIRQQAEQAYQHHCIDETSLRQLINSIDTSDASKHRTREKIESLQAERNSHKLMQALHFNDGIRYSRNLGQNIARYQDTASTQAYLDLIKDLMDKPDVANTAVLALLTSQTTDGFTLGHIIASYRDAASTQAYLSLITTLMNDATIANCEVLTFLTSGISGGYTLGHFIAWEQDAASTQAYLGLITTLMNDATIANNDVLALLTSQTFIGNTFLGHLIARYQDAASTQAYLGLITTLMNDATIASNDVLALLTSQTSNGWTLSHFIAYKQDAASTQAYLGLIITLMNDATIANREVLAFLTSQTSNGWTLGHLIAWYQNDDCFNQFIESMSGIVEDEALSILLAIKTERVNGEAKEMDVVDILIDKNKIACLQGLLDKQILNDTQIAKIAEACEVEKNANPTYLPSAPPLNFEQRLKRVGFEGQIDPLYICPISGSIMNEPVLLSDGYHYEKSEIDQWIENCPSPLRSPMTNQPTTASYTVNLSLKSAIIDFVERQERSYAASSSSSINQPATAFSLYPTLNDSSGDINKRQGEYTPLSQFSLFTPNPNPQASAAASSSTSNANSHPLFYDTIPLMPQRINHPASSSQQRCDNNAVLEQIRALPNPSSVNPSEVVRNKVEPNKEPPQIMLC